MNNSFLLDNPPKSYEDDESVVYSCEYFVTLKTISNKPLFSNSIAQDLFREYLNDFQFDYGFEIISVQVNPRHVHIFIRTNPKKGIYKTVNSIKRKTSGELRKNIKEFENLPAIWQRQMFISTVGNIGLNDIYKFENN